MRFLFFSLLVLVISSCKQETLAPKGLKKVLLVQVDYNTYTFEGGKEFSYFENDNSKVELPIEFFPFPNATNRLTALYINDTIFDGIQSPNGIGERLYPTQIDPSIHYFRNKNPLDKPDTSHFQTLFYDLVASEEIPYDSIWTSISLLTIVSEYQTQNNTANIGLFLFRPTASSATKEDWKWYLVFKN